MMTVLAGGGSESVGSAMVGTGRTRASTPAGSRIHIPAIGRFEAKRDPMSFIMIPNATMIRMKPAKNEEIQAGRDQQRQTQKAVHPPPGPR